MSEDFGGCKPMARIILTEGLSISNHLFDTATIGRRRNIAQLLHNV